MTLLVSRAGALPRTSHNGFVLTEGLGVVALASRPAPAVDATAVGAPTRRWRRVCLFLLILAVGLGARLHGLDSQPLNFHPARQYRSAIIARAMYLDRTLPAADPSRVAADAAARAQGTLEPEVMEEVTSFAYQIVGHEALWVPRLLSSLIWLLGGIALYRLLGMMTGLRGQSAGLLAFVLLPLGVEGGRSFQPDALMVTLMLTALLAMVRHDHNPGRRRLLLAAALSGAAIFVKPMAFPMLMVAFLVLERRRRGAWTRTINRETTAFAVVSSLPAALFYSTVFVGGSTYFVPSLLLRVDFYRAWLRTLDGTFGLPVLAAAIAGMILAPRWRSFLAALWVGYILFGIAVDYRTVTHTYYHLQLVAVVALGIGLLVDHVGASPIVGDARMKILCVRGLAVVVLGAALVTALRGQGSVQASESGSVAVDRQIGGIVKHDAALMMVTNDYGVSLEYTGRVAGREYPSPGDDALMRMSGGTPADTAAILRTPIDGQSPRWLVITDWAQWQVLTTLRAYATAHATFVSGGPRWAVYRLAGGLSAPAE